MHLLHMVHYDVSGLHEILQVLLLSNLKMHVMLLMLYVA